MRKRISGVVNQKRLFEKVDQAIFYHCLVMGLLISKAIGDCIMAAFYLAVIYSEPDRAVPRTLAAFGIAICIMVFSYINPRMLVKEHQGMPYRGTKVAANIMDGLNWIILAAIIAIYASFPINWGI